VLPNDMIATSSANCDNLLLNSSPDDMAINYALLTGVALESTDVLTGLDGLKMRRVAHAHGLTSGILSNDDTKHPLKTYIEQNELEGAYSTPHEHKKFGLRHHDGKDRKFRNLFTINERESSIVVAGLTTIELHEGGVSVVLLMASSKLHPLLGEGVLIAMLCLRASVHPHILLACVLTSNPRADQVGIWRNTSLCTSSKRSRNCVGSWISCSTTRAPV
jgi:hypothetical protein